MSCGAVCYGQEDPWSIMHLLNMSPTNPSSFNMTILSCHFLNPHESTVLQPKGTKPSVPCAHNHLQDHQHQRMSTNKSQTNRGPCKKAHTKINQTPGVEPRLCFFSVALSLEPKLGADVCQCRARGILRACTAPMKGSRPIFCSVAHLNPQAISCCTPPIQQNSFNLYTIN